MRVRPDTTGFRSQVEKDVTGTFASIARRTRLILGVGGAIGALKTLFVDPIKSAGDFQQALNVLQATANATDKQMRSVQDTAIALGADIKLPATSAKDATDAMLELAKAGFSVTASQRAARGVIELSTAAQVDNATAAQIAANAINAFGLRASESTRVADLLAGAANASSASMTDVAQSLQFAASVAHQAKVPIEDVVTAIAEMANRGISGSVAGSALAQTLRSLQAPSAKGAAELKALGINVFDAAGNFRGLRPLIADFTKATEGMTQAERAHAIQSIFGSRAQQAANIVLLGGVKAFDQLKQKTTEQGAAQKLASAQTKGFSGAMAALRSTVETLQIQIGLRLLPVMTRLVHSLATNLPGAVNGAVSVVEGLANVVGVLADHFDVIGPLLGIATAAFVAYRTAVLVTTAAQAAYATVTATVNTAQLLLTGGTSALAAAQAAQAATTATLTAEQFAAIASTSGLAAAEAALAASTDAAAASMAVLDAAVLANPIGLLTIAIAGSAGLIFALGHLGSSTDALKAPFDSAQGAVQNLTDALNRERDAVFALEHDNVNLRQSHLDVTRTTAALADANGEVAAKQRIVNELQRQGQTDTAAYRKAQEDLTAAKQAETQASIDHERALIGEGEASRQQTKDLLENRNATRAAADQVAGFAGKFRDLSTAALAYQAEQEAVTKGSRGYDLAVGHARQNVASFVEKIGDLSGRLTDSLPRLQATKDKADALALSYKGSDSRAADAARAYAHNADAAFNAAKKLARLESTASLLAAAWGRIVDLPTAQFFIKETTQLTTIETNRLRRAGGGGVPAGVLSLTGEQGPELSIASTGRQIISKGDTVGLFRAVGDGLNNVARALAEQAQRGTGGGTTITIDRVVTDNPLDFSKQLSALVIGAQR